jgi:hypothetical protein
MPLKAMLYMYLQCQHITTKEAEHMSYSGIVSGILVIFGSNTVSFYMKTAIQLVQEQKKSWVAESLICLSSLGFPFNLNFFSFFLEKSVTN